jgi:uncharacterized protein (DUF1697 family)
MAVKRYAVLLRGINLGSRNRLRMPDFREALEDAGFKDVVTLMQSGNAVVSHTGSANAVEKAVLSVLSSKFDLDVDVVVRSAAQLRKIAAEDPFDGRATEGKLRFVVFCSEAVDAQTLPEPDPPEELAVRRGRRELHTWCPRGVRDGKLMNQLGRRPPAPVTTFRNWNTVTGLADLSEPGRTGHRDAATG